MFLIYHRSMEEIQAAIKAAVQKLFDVDTTPELSRPDEQFGDYSTNVALKLDQNPRQAAEAIAEELKSLPMISDVQVAGPGFINLKLTDEYQAYGGAQESINVASTR